MLQLKGLPKCDVAREVATCASRGTIDFRVLHPVWNSSIAAGIVRVANDGNSVRSATPPRPPPPIIRMQTRCSRYSIPAGPITHVSLKRLVENGAGLPNPDINFVVNFAALDLRLYSTERKEPRSTGAVIAKKI